MIKHQLKQSTTTDPNSRSSSNSAPLQLMQNFVTVEGETAPASFPRDMPQTRARRVHELNWLNWKNWMEALGCHASNWTEWTFLNQFWTEFASPWHYTTSRTSRQAQPVKRIIPPPRRHTPSRRDGITAGGDLEPFLCSPQTVGGSMDWIKSELNWTEALCPHAPNWTERTFRTNWWRGNWTDAKPFWT